MTPAQHRARAQQLRKNPAPIKQEIARHHEQVAKLIEHRERREARSV
jgi:septal ring factor EnvC (AmiA/AmiB activator)